MKRLRPVLSIMLSLLVLISGTSFIVGVHHCNGRVASVALFTLATPCAMEQKTPPPPCHQGKKSCCSDERIVHNSDDLKPATSAIHVLPAPLVAELASPIVIATLMPSQRVLEEPLIAASPPLPLPDIQIAQSKFQI
jgi:hypothetical protein